jgi:hypothetical protein
MNQLHYPNEKELMLEPRWFTGQEWADGTAQHELKREFIAAVKSYNKVKVIRKSRGTATSTDPKHDFKSMSLMEIRRAVGKLRFGKTEK